jgi:hypothetical protein
LSLATTAKTIGNTINNTTEEGVQKWQHYNPVVEFTPTIQNERVVQIKAKEVVVAVVAEEGPPEQMSLGFSDSGSDSDSDQDETEESNKVNRRGQPRATVGNTTGGGGGGSMLVKSSMNSEEKEEKEDWAMENIIMVGCKPIKVGKAVDVIQFNDRKYQLTQPKSPQLLRLQEQRRDRIRQHSDVGSSEGSAKGGRERGRVVTTTNPFAQRTLDRRPELPDLILQSTRHNTEVHRTRVH